MIITALEIRQKTFVKSFRGYEKEEVDTFLNSLSQEWEKMVEHNKEMKRKCEVAELESQKLKSVESSLFKTLRTAEEASTNIISNAELTAQSKIEEANKVAQIKVDDATKTAKAILDEAIMKSEEIIQDAEKSSKNALDNLDQKVKALHQEVAYLEAQKTSILEMLGKIVNATSGAIGVQETEAPKSTVQFSAEYRPNYNNQVTESFFEEVNKIESENIELIINETSEINNAKFQQKEEVKETISPKEELKSVTLAPTNEITSVSEMEETVEVKAEVEEVITVKTVVAETITDAKQETFEPKAATPKAVIQEVQEKPQAPFHKYVLVDKTDEEPTKPKFENSTIEEDVSFFDMIK